MTDLNVVDYKVLDFSNIFYNDPNKIKGGSYMSLAYYNYSNTKDKDFKPLVIQTPKLQVCNGITKTDTKAYIELNIDKSHWPFYEFMTGLDEHSIIYIEKNSKRWFQKYFPLDIVENFYKTPIKAARNKNPPKLKLKIPISKGLIGCSIYNSKNELLEHTDVMNNDKIVCIIKLLGLRFLKQQVICEWQPLQFKVYKDTKINNNIKGYIIKDDLLSDDEFDNSSNNIDKFLPVINKVDNKPENTESIEIEESNTEADNIVDDTEADNTVDDTKTDIKETEESNNKDNISENNNLPKNDYELKDQNTSENSNGDSNEDSNGDYNGETEVVSVNLNQNNDLSTESNNDEINLDIDDLQELDLEEFNDEEINIETNNDTNDYTNKETNEETNEETNKEINIETNKETNNTELIITEKSEKLNIKDSDYKDLFEKQKQELELYKENLRKKDEEYNRLKSKINNVFNDN
jgi:hypothetical protein